MMHNQQLCNHLSCRLKLKLGPYANLSALVAASFVGLVLLLCWRFYGNLSEESQVQDAAFKFAQDFKSAEEEARQTKRVLTIQFKESKPGAPVCYTIYDEQKGGTAIPLPEAISGTGRARLDPEGIPMTPATFVFSKGTHSVKMEVDIRGAITFPEPASKK